MSSLMILHIGPIWSILFGKLKWFLCTLMGQLMATWQRVNQNMSPWTSQVLTLTAHISEDRDMSPVCKHDHYLFTICSCIASIACIHTNGINWQLLESQNQPLHLPRLHFTLKRGVQLSASHTDTLYIIFKHILTWSICVYLILQRNWGAAQSMAAKRPKRTGNTMWIWCWCNCANMRLLSGCSKLDVYLDVLATSSLKEHTARGHNESMELFGVLAIEVSYILSRNPSKSFLNSLQVHIPHPFFQSEPDSKRTFQNGTAKSCFNRWQC